MGVNWVEYQEVNMDKWVKAVKEFESAVKSISQYCSHLVTKYEPFACIEIVVWTWNAEKEKAMPEVIGKVWKWDELALVDGKLKDID